MTGEQVLAEQEVRIDATPETVYAFLTQAELMQRWMGVDVELEPRQGGLYRCNVNGRDRARGEFVELVPHSRVVFTFGWEGEDHPVPPGSSTVEITLTAEGQGTRLHLVHRDLPQPLVDQHTDGWKHYLERLAVAAAGNEPGPDPMLNAETNEN